MARNIFLFLKGIKEFDASTISIFNDEGILKLKSGYGYISDVKEPSSDIGYTTLLDLFSENKWVVLAEWKTKKTLPKLINVPKAIP